MTIEVAAMFLRFLLSAFHRANFSLAWFDSLNSMESVELDSIFEGIPIGASPSNVSRSPALVRKCRWRHSLTTRSSTPIPTRCYRAVPNWPISSGLATFQKLGYRQAPVELYNFFSIDGSRVNPSKAVECQPADGYFLPLSEILRSKRMTHDSANRLFDK